MTTVKIVEVPDSDWIEIVSRYDSEVVSTIKEISPNFREWVPTKKLWRVLGEYGPQLTEALVARGHDVVGEDPPAPDIAAFFGVEPDDGYDAKAKAAEVIDSIPAQFVGKVFRAMSRQLYPDLYKR